MPGRFGHSRNTTRGRLHLPGNDAVDQSRHPEPCVLRGFFWNRSFLSVASIYQFHTDQLSFWLMLVASICYLIGTVGVTGLGNVPLNDQLDLLDLPEMANTKLAEFRAFYESNWNRLHVIRTAFAVLSFFTGGVVNLHPVQGARVNSNFYNIKSKEI